jgi:hypothetical protein
LLVHPKPDERKLLSLLQEFSKDRALNGWASWKEHKREVPANEKQKNLTRGRKRKAEDVKGVATPLRPGFGF